MRLVRSSLFRQPGVLPHLLDFLQSRVHPSCALKKVVLKIKQLLWGTLILLGQFQIPEHAEVCCPKVQDFYFAVHLACISWGLKVHHLIGSVAKAAINSLPLTVFSLFVNNRLCTQMSSHTYIYVYEQSILMGNL